VVYSKGFFSPKGIYIYTLMVLRGSIYPWYICCVKRVKLAGLEFMAVGGAGQ